MKFTYPIELSVGNDAIAVQDDEGKITYELVTAVYRQGDRVVVVETAEKRMLRLDPGLKVQVKSMLYQPRPGRTYQPREEKDQP